MSFEYKGKVYKLVEQTKEDRDAFDNYPSCAGCAFCKDLYDCAAAPSCSTGDDGEVTYVFKEVSADV